MVRYEHPDDIEVGDMLEIGDKLWARAVRTNRDEMVLLRNPAWNDSNQYIRIPLPDFFEYEKFNETARLKNRGEWLFVEITEKFPQMKAELLPNSEWPIEKSHSKDGWKMPNPRRNDAIPWRGTPQKSDGDDARSRSKVAKEEDIRGSKNDLL